jgi:hypothetical protein
MKKVKSQILKEQCPTKIVLIWILNYHYCLKIKLTQNSLNYKLIRKKNYNL